MSIFFKKEGKSWQGDQKKLPSIITLFDAIIAVIVQKSLLGGGATRTQWLCP